MDGIFLSQYKYAKELIDMAHMTDTETFDPPIELSVKFNKNSGESVSDPILYSTLVGRLIYLTTTRSDISYAIQIVGQFMSDFMSSSLEYCSSHGSLSTWLLGTSSVVCSFQKTLVYSLLPMLAPIEQDILRLVDRGLV